MTSPPSSIPSPTPSSGSSQHQQQKPQTFSAIAAYHPPSSGSTATAAPGGNQAESGDAASSDSYSDVAQQTPQAQPASGPNNSRDFQSSAAFLPQVTASPPPHPVPYIPPPQHAMAPDPIHSLSPGGGGQPSVWGAGWRPGPPPGGPNGSGYPNPQAGYGGRGGPPPPNGHLTHQLPPNPVEAYGPSSRPSVSTTPGVVAMPPGSNGGTRSGSQPGEPRDGRRQRHRDEESRDREDEEVISTIFVVGFPDDMSEREFQNIFTFAPGFEAATLKFPSGSARREPAAAAALLAELQHLAATQGQPLMGSEHPDQQQQQQQQQQSQQQQQQQQQQLDDQFAAMNFATQSSSASNTPSAAMSLTPSAQTGTTLGGSNIPPSVPPRRQTIGFARFKTRADALAARDHLQGRRIDTLTGATLKAEMAKKNLHTKRGVAGDDLVGLLLRSGRLSQLVSQQAQAQGLPGGAAGGLGQPNQPGGGIGAPGQNPGAIQSAKEAWDAWPAPGQTNNPESASNDMLSAPQQGTSSSHSNTSGSPPQTGKSPNSRPTDSKALLALAEEADELEGWSVGSVGMGGIGFDYSGGGGPSGPRSSGGMSPGGPMSATSPIHGGGGGSQHLGYGGGYGTGQQGPYNSALGFSQDSGGLDPRSLGITANMNPADQNPPINTLYIGNLPAISPPTHPPNFLEESLRALFQRRPGFKRMSFRQKINGPMCFVEFEDIPYASQAMRELYGNTLNGLVKGGIRLSYSKNSLGQRGNSHQQAMGGSMFGGLAHTVALAGMSGAQPGSGGPIPAGNGQGPYPMSGGSQPVPIGPPSGNQPGSSDRRQGEASSLSPTAQPFNAPLPTSPRAQRFYGGGRDSERTSGTSSGNTNQSQGTAIPQGSKQDGFNTFSPPSGVSQQGFSPVSSPIRTPASLGWVSSSGSNSNNAFGAFDAFGLPPHGLGSLNGAASAWGQSNSGPSSS